MSQVAAIDGLTGKTLWVYDPKIYEKGVPPGLGFVHRGVALWPEGKQALRRNPTGWLIDGAFRYTLQFEEQRLDEDSGMAGLPGVSE
jgi:hypothetical protein